MSRRFELDEIYDDDRAICLCLSIICLYFGLIIWPITVAFRRVINLVIFDTMIGHEILIEIEGH